MLHVRILFINLRDYSLFLKMIDRAGVILINNKDEILLVLGKKANKWSIPKGHMDDGETLYDTAHRELKEETGVTIDPKVDTYTGEATIKRVKYYAYSTTRSSDDIKSNVYDEREVDRIEWVKQDDIKILDANVSLRTYDSHYKGKISPKREKVVVTDDDGWNVVITKLKTMEL